MNRQKSELSALLDGELEPHEVEAIVRQAKGDAHLQADWHAYVAVSDVLRGQRVNQQDLTASIMAKIADEPAILAPRNLPISSKGRHRHPLLALAASVAGVALVGLLAFSGSQTMTEVQFVQLAVPPAPTISREGTQVVAKVAPRDDSPKPADSSVIALAESKNAPDAHGDLSEYLLAHHTHASSFRLGDSAEHIRTVSISSR